MTHPLARALERAGLADRLAEAERLLADRKASERQANELHRAARERYRRDPLAHTRAQLAARVTDAAVGLYVGDDGDAREVALTAAAIALELVERDSDTTEAKLERVRDLTEDLLAAGNPAGRRLLDALAGFQPGTATGEASA